MIRFVECLQNGEIIESWSQLSSSDQLVFPILAANLLIFVLWRIPSLRPKLVRLFEANPYGRKYDCYKYAVKVLFRVKMIIFRNKKKSAEAPCRSMFLSLFSHPSSLQLTANMLALYSFSEGICYHLGHEQAMFLFVSAGLFAHFVSYTRKVLRGINISSNGAVSIR